MIERWLSWLNCLILAIIGLLLVGMGWIWLNHPKEITCGNPVSKHCRLPQGAFALEEEAYASINEPLLTLQSFPPSLQVPDLRQHLLYYGKNGRPDAQVNRTYLHFSLNGQKAIVSIPPGERLYLIYDKKSVPSHYVFSPNNEPTSLWLEATSQDNEALVKIMMKNERDEVISEPEQWSQFKLPEKEFIRFAGNTWELGSYRVDGTLLARQRARWFGIDRFLERHGGAEYQHVGGKQRVDFGENDEVYSVFVGVGDCLIWSGNRWVSVTPGEDSLKYPLLVIKKVEERLMALELWDVEGKGKVVLNLLKSSEPWLAHQTQHIQHTFKFVGARTRTQCVFEINNERMLISPSDWLLLTSKGWKKLITAEEIDDYVKRKTVGMLFVFEGLSRKEDRQMMRGILYNPSRSDYQEIELTIQQASAAKSNSGIKEDKESTSDTPPPPIVKPETDLIRPPVHPYPIKEQNPSH